MFVRFFIVQKNNLSGGVNRFRFRLFSFFGIIIKYYYYVIILGDYIISDNMPLREKKNPIAQEKN